MSKLGSCAACKSRVAVEANQCPKCGQPGPFETSKGVPKTLKRLLLLWLGIFIFGFGACTVIVHRATDPASIQADHEAMIQALSPEDRALFAKFGDKPKLLTYTVATYLKSIARDPDSVKVETCGPIGANSEGWLTECRYQMKNGLGGMNRQSEYFVIRNGEVRKHF